MRRSGSLWDSPFVRGIGISNCVGLEALLHEFVLDGRTVSSVVLPSISDPGGHRALNEKGELCFEVYFEDGTAAIYVARPRS